jgi:hypothetical protein
MTFKLSLFKKVADNKPKAALRTWQEFCDRLANPEIRADKDGPLFSPATFDPQARAKANVVELSMLGLDCDHGNTLESDLPRWRKHGYTFGAYTTHSHKRVTDSNPNAEERFRLVLPLAAPIPPIYYPALWAWANHASGGKLDPSARDASRMFYIPAKASEDAEYFHEVHDGALLDWRELPALKWVVKAFESEMAALDAAANGSRNDQLFKTAAALGELIAGDSLDEDRVVRALDEAAVKIGLEAKETQKTIQSGLRTGRAKPRQPDFDGKPGAKKTTTDRVDTKTEAEAGTKEGEKADAAEDGGKQSLSSMLIKLALEASKLFHDAGGDCYATVEVKGHKETYKVGSRAHKDWLAGLLYSKTQQAARTDVLTDTVTILRAKALYEGEKKEAHVRLAEHDGAIYLDLCDDQWRQVKITEGGWDVVTSEKSLVRFVRAKGMLALPEPKKGGSADLLRDLLNLPEGDKDNWPLIAGWLVAAFKPNGDGFDYPLLAIHGEQGSGKSTAQRLLRDLIDPNKATLRAAPRDERDLAIAAAHGRVISCDNLTHISEPLSNAFCRLATGGGFATRELFSDDGEVIFDAQRPVIVNGIAEVVTKSDLLDRAILVYLPTIPKGKRWKKRVLNRKFIDAQPLILGALLDAVSAGLRRMGEGIELDEWPRMSDFAEWAIACETALGFKAGDFIKAYTKNIERADDLAIEASPLAQEILALLDAEPAHVWDGTTGDLLKALNGRLEARKEEPKKVQGWPQSARSLGAKLKELAPNLRRLGLDVSYEARGKRGYRLKLIYTPPTTKAPPQPPQTDPSVREVPNDVHHVHHVHRTNGDNDLGGEHVGEHVGNGTAPNVHPSGNGATATAGGEHLDGELFGNVHPNVHPANGCKQMPSEQGEHGEHYSETPEHEQEERDEDLRQRIAAQRQKFDNPNITPPDWTAPF